MTFGSTLALAGIQQELREDYGATPVLIGSMPLFSNTRLRRWLHERKHLQRQELLDIYETPLTAPQMRALFRLHPELNVCSPAFDESIHTESRQRTEQQHAAGRVRVRGYNFTPGDF